MSIDYKRVKKIAVSCEAGIGASVMGAAVLKKLLDAAQIQVIVEAVAIRNLNEDYDLVIIHSGFKHLVQMLELKNQVIYVDNYLEKKLYNQVVEELKNVK